jgi:ubiquinone/menaquinone biosynthesis C-methylase UbiE
MLSNFRLRILNREAASPKNKPDEIINLLNISDGDIMGDIGAGGGYFTYQFSRKVGKNGKVYSIDTNRKSLDFIEYNLKDSGIKNIKTILGNEHSVPLPERVDMFFMRNVFHHLSLPDVYLKNIIQLLKKNGKLVIIDHQKEGFSLASFIDHFIPEETIIKIVEKAGFCMVEKYDFVPKHVFLVFEMK